MTDTVAHQAEAPNFVGAALSIAQAYDLLGKPEWFGLWLSRVARDLRRNPPNVGEAEGRA